MMRCRVTPSAGSLYSGLARVWLGAGVRTKGTGMHDAKVRADRSNAKVRLYHGSDVAIEHPDTSHNSGYADLGKGFYLTDDHAAARRRALSRARRVGADVGVVSAFELDESCVPWAEWGAGGPQLPTGLVGQPFGLHFAANGEGIIGWATYIQACRRGETAVAGLGSPAIVRAWIATEEIEMASSGLVPVEALAEYVDPADLIVQYCLLDQRLIDRHLTFIETGRVDRTSDLPR